MKTSLNFSIDVSPILKPNLNQIELMKKKLGQKNVGFTLICRSVKPRWWAISIRRRRVKYLWKILSFSLFLFDFKLVFTCCNEILFLILMFDDVCKFVAFVCVRNWILKEKKKKKSRCKSFVNGPLMLTLMSIKSIIRLSNEKVGVFLFCCFTWSHPRMSVVQHWIADGHRKICWCWWTRRKS